jgi:hypothetical protein
MRRSAFDLSMPRRSMRRSALGSGHARGRLRAWRLPAKARRFYCRCARGSTRCCSQPRCCCGSWSPRRCSRGPAGPRRRAEGRGALGASWWGGDVNAIPPRRTDGPCEGGAPCEEDHEGDKDSLHGYDFTPQRAPCGPAVQSAGRTPSFISIRMKQELHQRPPGAEIATLRRRRGAVGAYPLPRARSVCTSARTDCVGRVGPNPSGNNGSSAPLCVDAEHRLALRPSSARLRPAFCPASSHPRMSRRILGPAIRCATIRINHSWSTES